ncbi:hypothetical protein Acr_03g0004330 [Actinidia rufa]|uniref:Uncharacterized protein n=1 Tax=Actinidia rufa TaxID=165716 RepID=A0A7J0ECR8_9ERIC|nr:hypothetical protein Acr_03g0004330 [Actinidia rufa]
MISSHNSLISSYIKAAPPLCKAVIYPGQVLAALWITEPILWPIPAKFPDLEGLHCDIHGMAEQMRLMNENNAHLIQLLAAANPPPLAAPPIPDAERSHRSRHSGDHSQNHSTSWECRERRRSPSPISPRHERSLSLSESRVVRRSDVQSFFCHFEGVDEIVVHKATPGDDRFIWRSKSTLCRQLHELQNQAEECLPPLYHPSEGNRVPEGLCETVLTKPYWKSRTIVIKW